MKWKIYLLPVLAFIMFTATSCPDDEKDYPDVFLMDIEIHNLDNSDRYIFESDNPINRNAFAIGVIHCIRYDGDDENTCFSEKESYYNSHELSNFSGFPKIFCNEDFNEDYPAGSEVTKFFKFSRMHIKDYDLLILLVDPPAPGTYSFQVVYNCENGIVIEKGTPPITLF